MKEQKKRLGNSGFSLVELIVVIAIMAILMAVIAPTLIGKIEEARESTDLSTVNEIKQQVVNSLADEEIYNELVATGDAVYVLDTECKLTKNGTEVTGASAELKTVIGSYELKSKACKDKKVSVKVTEKGKVRAFVPKSDGSDEAVKGKKYTFDSK